MSELHDLFSSVASKPEEVTRCVVRVTSSWFLTNRGLQYLRRLTYLRRKCCGFDFLAEDCAMAGVETVGPRIINFGAVPDGVYRLITCNERKDWETGCVDDYDYKLVPLRSKVHGRAPC